MKKREIGLYFIIAILVVMCIEMIFYGGMGVGFALTALTYLIGFYIYVRLSGFKLSRLGKWLMLPILLSILCFVLFSNTTLGFFNLFFLMGLLMIQAFDVFAVCRMQTFEKGWLLDSIYYAFKLGFGYLDRPVTLMRKSIKEESQDKFKVVGKVLLGLIIAFPVLCILTGLLISSDAAFEGVLTKAFDTFSFSFEDGFVRFVLFIFLYFPLFSFFYGLVASKEEEAAVSSEVGVNSGMRLDFVIMSTIMSLICLVYIVYILSQFVYFISAFQGILPEDYTFSSYARRGFFESLPITGLNLLFILLLGKLLKAHTGGKALYIKSMIGFITAVALFIVGCAFSKMVMYMTTYGLTLWRVYTSWFLALCTGVIILIVLQCFWHKLPLIKSLFIFFTAMYLGLNYANVDQIVARQNVRLYEKGVQDNISACIDLSSSGMVPVIEETLKKPELLEAVSSNYSMIGYYGEELTTKEILAEKMEMIKAKNWQSWNLADYKAAKSYEALIKQ